MSLPINDIAPDFTAGTTQGPINSLVEIGDSWDVHFSHPKDFTVSSLEKQFAHSGPHFARHQREDEWTAEALTSVTAATLAAAMDGPASAGAGSSAAKERGTNRNQARQCAAADG